MWRNRLVASSIPVAGVGRITLATWRPGSLRARRLDAPRDEKQVLVRHTPLEAGGHVPFHRTGRQAGIIAWLAVFISGTDSPERTRTTTQV